MVCTILLRGSAMTPRRIALKGSPAGSRSRALPGCNLLAAPRVFVSVRESSWRIIRSMAAVPEPTDAALVQSARTGESEAYEELVARYQGHVYASGNF